VRHRPDCIVNNQLSDGLRLHSYVDADLCWEDIDWIKKLAPGKPIVLKGIQCVEVGSIAWVSGKSLRLKVLYRTPCWLPNMAYRASCCQTTE
jgi:hypothetical protein